MPRANPPRWSSRAGLALTALVVVLAAGWSIALMKARASTEHGAGATHDRQADGTSQVRRYSGRPPRRHSTDRAARTVIRARRDPFFPGVSPGPIAQMVRTTGTWEWRASPSCWRSEEGSPPRRAASRRGMGQGRLQVISRVGLSPKHTVYLLRAGGRVLLVGTGPQGAPSLISELDEVPQVEPAIGQGDVA